MVVDRVGRCVGAGEVAEVKYLILAGLHLMRLSALVDVRLAEYRRQCLNVQSMGPDYGDLDQVIMAKSDASHDLWHARQVLDGIEVQIERVSRDGR